MGITCDGAPSHRITALSTAINKTLSEGVSVRRMVFHVALLLRRSLCDGLFFSLLLINGGPETQMKRRKCSKTHQNYHSEGSYSKKC